jgi:hypothetical protein
MSKLPSKRALHKRAREAEHRADLLQELYAEQSDQYHELKLKLARSEARYDKLLDLFHRHSLDDDECQHDFASSEDTTCIHCGEDLMDMLD